MKTGADGRYHGWRRVVTAAWGLLVTLVTMVLGLAGILLVVALAAGIVYVLFHFAAKAW